MLLDQNKKNNYKISFIIVLCHVLGFRFPRSAKTSFGERKKKGINPPLFLHLRFQLK